MNIREIIQLLFSVFILYSMLKYSLSKIMSLKSPPILYKTKLILLLIIIISSSSIFSNQVFYFEKDSTHYRIKSASFLDENNFGFLESYNQSFFFILHNTQTNNRSIYNAPNCGYYSFFTCKIRTLSNSEIAFINYNEGLDLFFETLNLNTGKYSSLVTIPNELLAQRWQIFNQTIWYISYNHIQNTNTVQFNISGILGKEMNKKMDFKIDNMNLSKSSQFYFSPNLTKISNVESNNNNLKITVYNLKPMHNSSQIAIEKVSESELLFQNKILRYSILEWDENESILYYSVDNDASETKIFSTNFFDNTTKLIATYLTSNYNFYGVNSQNSLLFLGYPMIVYSFDNKYAEISSLYNTSYKISEWESDFMEGYEQITDGFLIHSYNKISNKFDNKFIPFHFVNQEELSFLEQLNFLNIFVLIINVIVASYFIIKDFKKHYKLF